MTCERSTRSKPRRRDANRERASAREPHTGARDAATRLHAARAHGGAVTAVVKNGYGGGGSPLKAKFKSQQEEKEHGWCRRPFQLGCS